MNRKMLKKTCAIFGIIALLLLMLPLAYCETDFSDGYEDGTLDEWDDLRQSNLEEWVKVNSTAAQTGSYGVHMIGGTQSTICKMVGNFSSAPYYDKITVNASIIDTTGDHEVFLLFFGITKNDTSNMVNLDDLACVLALGLNVTESEGGGYPIARYNNHTEGYGSNYYYYQPDTTTMVNLSTWFNMTIYFQDSRPYGSGKIYAFINNELVAYVENVYAYYDSGSIEYWANAVAFGYYGDTAAVRYFDNFNYDYQSVWIPPEELTMWDFWDFWIGVCGVFLMIAAPCWFAFKARTGLRNMDEIIERFVYAMILFATGYSMVVIWLVQYL